MNDYSTLEKTIVRELSCRLCLCNDVIKLKPLSAEVKRKMKTLFNITIRADDNLPKAICHECLQQMSALHHYTVKVEKTQKFLEFHRMKREDKEYTQSKPEKKLHPIIKALSSQNIRIDNKEEVVTPKSKSNTSDHQRRDFNSDKPKEHKKRSRLEMKLMEAMPLEEFARTESVDASLLIKPPTSGKNLKRDQFNKLVTKKVNIESNNTCDTLDPIVLVDGRPAKQGPELDKQITLFYKMECCICHEKRFDFRSLMKHYKDRHGVPGYVTCCNKQFHYFYPKKIIEHMAYHLQPNIFMCPSCHQNFQTSQELIDHESNGGRTEGKLVCPRCTDRYPTYRELGQHVVTHRADKHQCDYCSKMLKHHHRKKTINHMEDMILCSQCVRMLRSIEKQEKETKDKVKGKGNDVAKAEKYRKFYKALDISADEDISTE